MHLHPNAKLTPKTRRLLVDRIREKRWPVARAARAAGVTRPTAYKWLRRFEQGGSVALCDRSSRPHCSPRTTGREALRRMEQLRRRKKAAWEIALETGIPVATVSRQLKRLGLGRLWRLDEAGWRTPTPAEGWDVATVIAHLAWTDEAATAAATDKEAWDALVLEALEDPEHAVDKAAHAGAQARPAAILERWRTARSRLAGVLRDYPDDQRMPWYGPPMSATSMATARAGT